jgi:TonB family protein
MKASLLFSLFIFLTLQLVSQTVPGHVEFKVRKKDPSKATPFIAVEMPATFRGGDLSEFNVWVVQNIRYPAEAVEKSIYGRVYVQFVVNEKGRVADVKVLREVHPALDAEALRVIKASPLWTPPRQGGRVVRQLFTLPVEFKLQD